MKKKLPLFILLFVAIGWGAFQLLFFKRSGGLDFKNKKFNVILISIDTLRADHLSCYDYPRPTSPAIDAFRKDSVLFRLCISHCSSTLASHASILTSLIPVHHRAFFTRSQPLPENVTTMAELLKEKKYHTVSYNDGGQIAPDFGLNQGFDIYESMGNKYRHDNLHFKRIVDHSISWMEENRKKDNGKFFLFLHTYETHHPYTPGKKYLEMFDNGYNGTLPEHISVPLIKQINKGEVEINDADKQHIIDTYDAEIRSMDDSFKRLMTYLKENNLYDNTMIIFTSDHGEEFGEHGKWAIHSNTLFNEQIHVPLIIKLPESRFAGTEVNYLTRSIDILPTVMHLLGEKPQSYFEGITLAPLIQGKEPKNEVFAISQRDMQKNYVRAYWSVMNKKWKLYHRKLYDLENDPKEQIDVSHKHQQLKTSLEKYAIHFMKKFKRKFRLKKVKPGKELRKTLETLGYL